MLLPAYFGMSKSYSLRIWQQAVDSADTQGKPDVAQSQAQRLIQDSDVALIGTYQSATASIVAQVAERSQVPFVIDVAVDAGILQHGYKQVHLSPPAKQ